MASANQKSSKNIVIEKRKSLQKSNSNRNLDKDKSNKLQPISLGAKVAAANLKQSKRNHGPIQAKPSKQTIATIKL